jgi:hypothetical protein
MWQMLVFTIHETLRSYHFCCCCHLSSSCCSFFIHTTVKTLSVMNFQKLMIRYLVWPSISLFVLTLVTDVRFLLQFRTHKVIYRRYAGLFFSMCVDITDNELAYLECIHLFVEILDHFFSNVCELDLVFNFHKVTSMSH